MIQQILRTLLILAFSSGSFWAVTDSVASCDIPAFIEVGKVYDYEMGKTLGTMQVAEIDKSSCWVKADTGFWINLNQLTSIKISQLLPLSQAPSQHAQMTPTRSKTYRDCHDCPEMVRLPDGEFEMGSTPDQLNTHPVTWGEPGRSDEHNTHWVKIKAFAIGQYEVTQDQWKKLMGTNPSHFSSCGDNCPVEGVLFKDVQEFIRKLNAKTGKTYRLPTEAEWTCSAYTERYDGSETSCANDISEKPGVNRGGSWIDYPVEVRSASRKRQFREFKEPGCLGFRLAQDICFVLCPLVFFDLSLFNKPVTQRLIHRNDHHPNQNPRPSLATSAIYGSTRLGCQHG